LFAFWSVIFPLFSIGGHGDFVAKAPQALFERLSQIALVIDDQNSRSMLG
jgi:hypothetical protein